MQSQSVRVALLSALMLTSPLFTFAAGQSRVHAASKSDIQQPVGAPQAVQFGKGTGISRNQPVTPENTLHLQTAVKSLLADQSANLIPKGSDSAFRK
jgi:hypothetical protein